MEYVVAFVVMVSASLMAVGIAGGSLAAVLHVMTVRGVDRSNRLR